MGPGEIIAIVAGIVVPLFLAIIAASRKQASDAARMSAQLAAIPPLVEKVNDHGERIVRIEAKQEVMQSLISVPAPNHR